VTGVRHSLIVAVAAVSLVGILSGCAKADPRASGQGPVPEDVLLLVSNAHRTMSIVNQAENILIRDCMVAAGFEFNIDRTTRSYDSPDPSLTPFVGVMTLDDAEQHGYEAFVGSPYFAGAMVDNDTLAADYEAMNREYREGLSPSDREEYDKAFDGGADKTWIALDDGSAMPAEGCLASSRHEVLGEDWLDVMVTFNAVQMVPLQLDINGDPDVISAGNAWRSCMEDAGYHFDTVSDAIAAGVAMRGVSVQPSAEEIAQAVADVYCQEDADLAQTTQQALDRAQQRVAEENLDVLLAWESVQEGVLQRASDIIGVTYTPLGEE